MLTPYPSSIDRDDVQVVVDLLKGKLAPMGRMVHCTWDVVGYANGQVLPNDTAAGLDPNVRYTPGFVADCLEYHFGLKKGLPSFSWDWKLLALTLVQTFVPLMVSGAPS